MKRPPLIVAAALLLLGPWSIALADEPRPAEPVMSALEVTFWKYPPSDPLNDELYKRLGARIAQVTKYGSNPATNDPLWIVRLADQISDKLASERFRVFLADVAERKRAQDAAAARLAAKHVEDEALAANAPRVSAFGPSFRGLQRSYPLFDGSLRCASLGRDLQLGGASLSRPQRSSK